MQIGSAIAIYFVIWWLVLFAMLPIGIKSQEEAGEVVPGSEVGAPAKPMLLKKMLWTTIASFPVLGIVWLWNVYGAPV
jgi:predicted secreted protein